MQNSTLNINIITINKGTMILLHAPVSRKEAVNRTLLGNCVSMEITLATVLKHPQSTFLFQCQRPSFIPVQNHRKIIVLHILIFKFFGRRREDRRFWTE
jgi:hypothetical protein